MNFDVIKEDIPHTSPVQPCEDLKAQKYEDSQQYEGNQDEPGKSV